jgi:hypothetical protein
MTANRRARERSSRLFLYVRELFRAALLLTAVPVVAFEPVTTSDFPKPSHGYFGLARIVAPPGKRVRLVTGGMEGKRIYAWFRGGGEYLRGWLPASTVRDLPF